MGGSASRIGTAFRSRAFEVLARGLLTVAAAIVVLGLGDAAGAAGRHAAMVVDANSGRAITEQSADEPRYPASLTKMMTIYVVFDLIEQRRLSYDTRVNFSEAATRVPPTKLGVEAGGSITVLEAVKALITKSANDASVALAEHIAGSEARFAALMTETARRIGMRATTFRNAHGLPHPEQVTTARDMITLGLRLQDDFPKHYPLFATQTFTHRGETHRNHNTLLTSYEGTDGIKTGYIGTSGFNLVANVRRGDKHVIGVVFGGASAGARNQTMRTLLNLALFKASTTRTRQVVPVARGKAVPQPVKIARPQTAAPVVAEAPARPVEVARPVPSRAAAEPQVQIAQVRPLPVVPRASVPAVEVSATRAATVAPPFIPPLASYVVPAPVVASPTRDAAPVPKGAPAAVPKTASAPVAASASASDGVQRGQAPSTLGAQAMALAARPALPVGGVAGPVLQPTYRLAGPTGQANRGAGGVEIQVGAYATKSDAERQLEAVRRQTGDLLAAYGSAAPMSAAHGKTVYRARYTGFDAGTAGGVCNELRRRQIDCMVAKAE